MLEALLIPTKNNNNKKNLKGIQIGNKEVKLVFSAVHMTI